jgi:hypothetical protein
MSAALMRTGVQNAPTKKPLTEVEGLSQSLGYGSWMPKFSDDEFEFKTMKSKVRRIKFAFLSSCSNH